MNTIDTITAILKKEGVEFLSVFPTTPILESAAQGGIRPVICRQERVGIGIADGFSRTTNGERIGVVAVQYGPGAENAYSGIATAFSDSSPILIMPTGHPKERTGIQPHFSSVSAFAGITKSVEQINTADRTSEVLRRAFSALRQGRPGPVLVEVPIDVAVDEVSEEAFFYKPTRRLISQGDSRDVEAAAKALCQARYPVILAGQGVLYADATDEFRGVEAIVAVVHRRGHDAVLEVQEQQTAFGSVRMLPRVLTVKSPA